MDKSGSRRLIDPVSPPIILAPIIALIDKLLMLCGNTPLDCEFAVTREGDDEVLWLLQARPLILSSVP